MGERFTQLPVDSPIGFFFEAMYRSGFYWNFLGWAQVLAAFLLMTQRFATLGAIFFFFIISNIWIITISLGFSGTWIITSLMLLAVLLLLVWDYQKLKYILYADNDSDFVQPEIYPTYNTIWIRSGFLLFSWSLGGLLLMARLDDPGKLISRVWLVGILLIVLGALYLNKKRNK
ncbi:MAG: DoxX family protein [Chitinophagaceae bacterium]|nr:MAG: DoxX family protein [Chitinophagaceae bacterium]